MTSTQKKRARNNHQPTGQWIRADKRLAIIAGECGFEEAIR